jgi:hypothetical protein
MPLIEPVKCPLATNVQEWRVHGRVSPKGLSGDPGSSTARPHAMPEMLAAAVTNTMPITPR